MGYDISTLLHATLNYTVNKVILQRWQDRRFSYMHTPRPDHGILLVTAGQMLFYTRREEILIKAGEMIYLPKGSCYEAVVLPEFGKTTDYLLNFDAEGIEGDVQPEKLLRGADPWYLETLKQIVDRSLRGEASPHWVKGRFYLFLDKVIQDCKRGADLERGEIMRSARELIVDDTLSIRKIASMCGVSESGFRQMFRQTYGCSPRQYRMENKLSMAKYYLESTELPVCQIAERLGFYDEAYFCKMFRKYVGCSPKRFMQRRKL